MSSPSHASTAEHMTDQPGALDVAPIDPATSKRRRRLLKLLATTASDRPQRRLYRFALTTGVEHQLLHG